MPKKTPRAVVVTAMLGALRIVESDPRFKAPPALVEINAPLALIQVDLKARSHTLRETLKMMGEKVPE